MSEDTNRDMEIRLAFEQQICNMRVEGKCFLFGFFCILKCFYLRVKYAIMM